MVSIRVLLLAGCLPTVACGRLAFDDHQPPGSACLSNDECAGTCIAGSCEAVSALMGPCDALDNADCQPGDVCIASRCLGDQGQSCAANAECADTCIASACAPLALTGGACDDSADCAIAGNTCDGTGTCVGSAAAFAPPTVAAGLWHTCAISAGALVCWGDNSAGQLGDTTINARMVPTPVTGLASGVTSVATGEYHTCAVQNGGVKCWGAQYGSGRLGDNSATATYTATPVQVVGLTTGAIAVVAGYYHTCALMMDHTVKCWGFPTSALGAGTVVANTNIPNTVNDPTGIVPLTNVTKLIGSPDGYHTCALVGDAAYCWGDNQTGELGDATIVERFLPTPVMGLATGVADMAANIDFTCAVLTSGAIRCTGTNSWGQLGNNSIAEVHAPVAVQGAPASATLLAAGNSHSCVVANGGVWCWGADSNSELGATGGSTCLGSYSCNLVPIAVTGLPAGSNVIGLVAGGGHTCAQLPGSKLRCWGRNASGELGNNSTGTTATPVTPIGF